MPPLADVKISKDEAVEALTAAAFTVSLPDELAALKEALEIIDTLCSQLSALAGIAIGAQGELSDKLERLRSMIPKPRTLIHSRVGGLGADHDLAYALHLVSNARDVLWMDNPIWRHELCVLTENDVAVFYDVARPERSGQ